MYASLSSTLRRTFLLAGLAACTTFTACDNDDDEKDPQPQEPAYTVPTTYNFQNVDYSGQTTRMEMLDEINAYIRTGNTGAVLDAQKLKDMYANQNNAFTDADLNAATSKQLKNKTFSLDQPVFEGYFDAVAQASTSAGAAASNGTAGILTSADGTRQYLVDENGVEYSQLIAKGLMGATFYYQAVESYLTEEKIGAGVDNTTVTPGKGTTMEHHWDEAFGYFGAPIDFPTNTTDTKYWANYSNQVNPSLNSNKALMDAFLKGRAAISNKDMEGKNAAMATVRNEWERLVAASTIHELNAAKANMADQAKKSHYLSEAKGFAMGLKYKGDRKISATQLTEVMNKIGDNFYNTTTADINAAIDILSNAYNMNDIKGTL